MPETRASVIYRGGLIVTYPVPPASPHAQLLTGPCRACAGTGRRAFPMPATHTRRIDRIPPHACHDCAGTGQAMAHAGSRAHRALLAALSHA